MEEGKSSGIRDLQLTIDLIAVTRDVVLSLWHKSETERDRMFACGDAVIELRGDDDTIAPHVGTFERVIVQAASILVKNLAFPTDKFELLDPPYLKDWLEKWKIFEQPEIACWTAKYGRKYPIYSSYLFATETLRTLLLRFQRRFPDAVTSNGGSSGDTILN